MPYCQHDDADLFALPLSAAMLEFLINTNTRECCFIAQIAHESSELRHTREIWGPTIQQSAYEGREDLGNDEPGDGQRFLGRGLIQITGRANYRLCSLALYGDDRLLDDPALLEATEPACRSAGWFWSAHGLNHLADQGDFLHITLRINGSTRTNPQRMVFYQRAQRVMA